MKKSESFVQVYVLVIVHRQDRTLAIIEIFPTKSVLKDKVIKVEN
jgi:hypothetical protein